MRQLVVFDLGRVLVRICDGWQHAFELAGVALPHDVLDEPTRAATAFPPERIVFFDDLAENVAAARERGWRAHLVERCDNPIPAVRKFLVDDGVW